MIRLARGDAEGAQSDAARVVELVRPIQDPQRRLTALPIAAFVFFSAEDEKRAEEVLDEALGHLRQLRQLGSAGITLHHLAWVARALGREADVLEVIERDPFKSRWLEVARAVALGEFAEAADLLTRIGNVSDEAFYRLRAAEQLVAEDRRAEADEQLGRALAFYRNVRATRYVREGEALLAATA